MSIKIGGSILLPNGADLNNVVIPGQYNIISTNTYLHTPAPSIPGDLVVRAATTDTTRIIQELTAFPSGSIVKYIRYGNQSASNNVLGGTYTFNSWYTIPTNIVP